MDRTNWTELSVMIVDLVRSTLIALSAIHSQTILIHNSRMIHIHNSRPRIPLLGVRIDRTKVTTLMKVVNSHARTVRSESPALLILQGYLAYKKTHSPRTLP